MFPYEVWVRIFESIPFQDYMSCLIVFPEFREYVSSEPIMWRLVYERVWRKYCTYLDREEIFFYLQIPNVPARNLPEFILLLQKTVKVINESVVNLQYQLHMKESLTQQPYARKLFSWSPHPQTRFQGHDIVLNVDTSQLQSVVQCFVIYKALDEFWLGSTPLPNIWELIYNCLDGVKYLPQQVDCLLKSKSNFVTI